MDPHRGLHRRLNKRQGLNGVVEDVVSGVSPSSTTSQNAGNPLGSGEVVGGLTSLVGSVPSLAAPSSGSSPTSTSGTPLMHPSSSSTGSITTPASLQSTPSTSSRISSSSSTSSTLPAPMPTPTPTSTPGAADVVYTSSDGTSIVYITSTLPVASTTAAPSASFLQNPSLEGGVFALVGIVVLIIAFIIVTWVIRKRRRQRLERDIAVAVTFDPGATEHYEHQEDSMEKHRLSGSSSGHGHGYGGYSYAVQPAYAPPQEYIGAPGAVGYPTPGYRVPSPNPVPYPTPSPVPQQPTGQGGANLTRKFSDRKPVPPLLPNPTYDPTNGHVSIPPQFYQR